MGDDLKRPALAVPMVPFAEGKRSEEFGHALLQRLDRRVSELREQITSRDNVANMPHGHAWTFQQQRKEGFAPETGEFEIHSTQISVHDNRILSNDLSLVQELIFDLAQQMYDGFMRRVVKEMEETCTRFGQVTNVKKGASIADGILASLINIHANVDADGKVSLPQMMLSPDIIERLETELLLRGNEFERKSAEVRANSEKNARDREAERLAKYDQR
jgi:hypothetical protein